MVFGAGANPAGSIILLTDQGEDYAAAGNESRKTEFLLRNHQSVCVLLGQIHLMEGKHAMQSNSFSWEKTPQLNPIQLILATFIPSAIAFAGFHLVLPRWVDAGMPVLIAYSIVAGVMLFGFVLIAIVLLAREARSMNLSLWIRMCLKRLTLKEWAIYGGIALVGLFAASGAQKIIPAVLDAIGFAIPAYMPFFLNPAIDPMAAEMSIVSPGLPLAGSYYLLPLIGIAILLNILAEELYFRAWMMPKMARYGAWSWVLSGTLFAFYHTFQIWLLPVLLISSLTFAFIFYRCKSTWLPFALHLIGNFSLSLLGILALIMR
jgi:membrane protease YdiL (CAAX protease family)